MLLSRIGTMKGLVSDLVSTMSNEELNRRDDDWIIFLQDHRANLRYNSKLVTLGEKDMFYYRYRLRKYLQEKHNEANIELAVMVANRFKTAMDFNLSTQALYVPTLEYVRNLRCIYKTIKVQMDKL